MIPPLTNTFPSFNTDAVCDSRASVILPVALQCPVVGSYSSALFSATRLLNPPLTNTVPFVNTDAVCKRRALVILPVLDHPRRNISIYIEAIKH